MGQPYQLGRAPYSVPRFRLRGTQDADTVPESIAVVRALRGLGDMLCAVPALRALRAALPRAHITLVGLPSMAWFVERFDRYLDALLEFPGFPGIPERPVAPRDFSAFLAHVQRHPHDLAIQMHGSGVLSNPFTVLLGARSTAGFYQPGQYCPDPERFLAYPEHEPEVRRHLQLMEFLGIPGRGEELEFPLRPADWSALAALRPATRLSRGSYVCVHPGAVDPARRWPAEHFATVADGLAAQGLEVVLTGSGQEAPLAAAVKAAMRSPALDLAGQTSIGALAALLAGARLLVCNDTGVSHLAAALRTPSIVIFLASDPVRWAPLDAERHRRLGRPQLLPADGAFGGAAGRRTGQRPPVHSLNAVTPRRALAEARSLLLQPAPLERSRVA